MSPGCPCAAPPADDSDDWCCARLKLRTTGTRGPLDKWIFHHTNIHGYSTLTDAIYRMSSRSQQSLPPKFILPPLLSLTEIPFVLLCSLPSISTRRQPNHRYQGLNYIYFTLLQAVLVYTKTTIFMMELLYACLIINAWMQIVVKLTSISHDRVANVNHGFE